VMYILVSFLLVLGRVEFRLPTVAMSSGFICLVSVSGQGELGVEMEMIFCSLHGEAKDGTGSDGGGGLNVSAACRVRLVVLSLLAIGVENLLLPGGGFWVKVVGAVSDFGSFVGSPEVSTVTDDSCFPRSIMAMSPPMFVHRSKRNLGADPGCQLLQLLHALGLIVVVGRWVVLRRRSRRTAEESFVFVP
jgi:hypothetical protein